MLTQKDCQTFKYIKSCFLFFNHRWIRLAVKGPTTRGVWGHAPSENFEILVLWNAISSVLRGQILSKMFSKPIVLFMLIFIGVTSRRSSQFYFIQVVRFLKLLWISLSAKYTLCGVIENFRTTVEIGNFNFLIPNAYWSGFGTVFEQNRKDPDKTRMIKESSQKYYFLWPHLCLTRLNEFRFFLTYFLRTSFKFSSMQSVECALKTR